MLLATVESPYEADGIIEIRSGAGLWISLLNSFLNNSESVKKSSDEMDNGFPFRLMAATPACCTRLAKGDI